MSAGRVFVTGGAGFIGSRGVDEGLPGLSLHTGFDDVPLGKVRHEDGPLPLVGTGRHVNRLRACSERKSRGGTGAVSAPPAPLQSPNRALECGGARARGATRLLPRGRPGST